MNLLLGLLIIFAPSNLFLVLCDGCGYVNGLQSDYLLPKLYLVDLIMVAIGIVGLWIVQPWTNRGNKKTWSNQQKILLILVVTLLVRQWWAPFPLVATWNLAQWFLLGWVGWVQFVPTLRRIIKKSVVLGALVLSLLLQTGVGLYQFTFQKPLFSYQILGETQIQYLVGIATNETRFEQKLAPYGTTAHPNILAGFIATYSFLLIKLLVQQKNSRINTLIASLTLAGSWIILALTQSFSGATMLASGGLILVLEQGKWLQHKSLRWWQGCFAFLVIAIFLFGVITTWLPINEKLRFNSVNRRQYLLETSWQMIADNWLWGSGLSNFTAIAESYSLTSEIVRFNQPVHHVGWLFVAETGLVGLVLSLTVLSQLKNDSKKLFIVISFLVFFLPVLVWDHYLLSLENGRLLFLLFFFSQFLSQLKDSD